MSSVSQLAYAKRRRAERVAAGQCGACGGAPEAGKRTCRACLDYLAVHRSKRTANSACTQCGAPRESGVYCRDCSATRNANLREKSAALKSQGRCRCGAPLRPTRHNCDVCFNTRKSRKHGLSRNEARDLLHKQGGACKLCAKPCVYSGVAEAHVDHDHATGTIRGVLCPGCNYALGGVEKLMRLGLLDAAVAHIKGTNT